MRYDCGSSGTPSRQLAVRHVTVDARFGREPEHALADHVAVHLAGAAADRAAELIEECERPVGLDRTSGAQQAYPELGPFSSRFGPDDFDDRTVDRTGSVGAHRCAHSFVQIAQDRLARI